MPLHDARGTIASHCPATALGAVASRDRPTGTNRYNDYRTSKAATWPASATARRRALGGRPVVGSKLIDAGRTRSSPW